MKNLYHNSCQEGFALLPVLVGVFILLATGSGSYWLINNDGPGDESVLRFEEVRQDAVELSAPSPSSNPSPQSTQLDEQVNREVVSKSASPASQQSAGSNVKKTTPPRPSIQMQPQQTSSVALPATTGAAEGSGNVLGTSTPASESNDTSKQNSQPVESENAGDTPQNEDPYDVNRDSGESNSQQNDTSEGQNHTDRPANNGEGGADTGTSSDEGSQTSDDPHDISDSSGNSTQQNNTSDGSVSTGHITTGTPQGE